MIFIRAISIKEFAIRMKNAGSNSIEIGNSNSFLLVHTIPIFDGKLSEEQAAKKY